MLNRQLKILLLINYIWCFSDGMLGPFLAVFTEKIGGNILDVSWAWAIYLAVAGILYIVFGRISDSRLGWRRSMVIGYYLCALFTFCYVFISAPWQLFLVQMGLAVAAALATPTWKALYSQYNNNISREEKGGLRWGLADGGAQILMAVAVILGGLILEYLSFNWLFVIMGVIQLVGAFYSGKIFKKSKAL